MKTHVVSLITTDNNGSTEKRAKIAQNYLQTHLIWDCVLLYLLTFDFFRFFRIQKMVYGKSKDSDLTAQMRSQI